MVKTVLNIQMIQALVFKNSFPVTPFGLTFLILNCESVSDLPIGYPTNLDPGLIFFLNSFSLADCSPIHGSISRMLNQKMSLDMNF